MCQIGMRLIFTLLVLTVQFCFLYSVYKSYKGYKSVVQSDQNYILDGTCPCTRVLPQGSEKGAHVGKSSCNEFTTALGAGQNVLTYSFYVPPHENKIEKTNFFRNKPKETLSRYTELLPDLLQSIQSAYPGFRVRIYHNISTSENKETADLFCNLHCKYSFLDLCDVTRMPRKLTWLNEHHFSKHVAEGNSFNLAKAFPIGRFWRFAAIGDPTVTTVMSRDVDSLILDREVMAVREWMHAREHFHLMRDSPSHKTKILAGLFGIKSFKDPYLSDRIRSALFSATPTTYKFLDQDTLADKVWPLVFSRTLAHDSYTCDRPWTLAANKIKPFPIQRGKEGKYVGYGPTKEFMRIRVQNEACPEICRPKKHKDWINC